MPSKMRAENCWLDLATQVSLVDYQELLSKMVVNKARELQQWQEEETESKERERIYKDCSQHIWMKKKGNNLDSTKEVL